MGVSYSGALGAAETGRAVIYRPYPGAAPEVGRIVRLSSNPAYAFVRYAGQETPKATLLADLEWES